MNGIDQFRDHYEASKFMLDECLIKPGFWGGGETIKAVAHLHNVNILIYHEDGPVVLVRSSGQIANHCIAIAYRWALGGIRRNHYDSVASVSANNITVLLKN